MPRLSPALCDPRNEEQPCPLERGIARRVRIKQCRSADAGAASGREGRGIVQLPLLVSGRDFDDAIAAVISGDLSLEGGCLRLGSAPAVWPRGTTWNASTEAVSLPSGATLALRSNVRAGGGYIHGAPLSDMLGDQASAAVAVCACANTDVAVLNAGPQPSAL